MVADPKQLTDLGSSSAAAERVRPALAELPNCERIQKEEQGPRRPQEHKASPLLARCADM